MRIHLSRVAGVAGLVLAAQALPAQQRRPLSFGMAATSMAITPATANRALVHNQTWGLQIDAGMLLKRVLYVGFDMGPQSLSDHATFTQNTTGGVRKSTASAIYFSAMAGPRTRPFQLPGLGAVSLGVYGGASATTARRSIENCTDCQVDKLEIPGGAFVQPTLLLGGGNVRLRLANRNYLTGDGIRYVASAGMELGGR